MKLARAAQIFFLIILIAAGGIGYVWFFHIDPQFVEKPVLEKPALMLEGKEMENLTSMEIGGDHVLYLLNELEAYKLHPSPVSGKLPVIKVIIDDADEYIIQIEDNELVWVEDASPDIIIHSSKEALLSAFIEEDMGSSVLDSFMDGLMWIEITNDETELAFKGYKTIYDKVTSNMDSITGNVAALYPASYKDGFSITLLLMLSTIVSMITKKEI